MIIAIFGVLLVMNRQTAGLFEEMFFFILPIPMTVFSLKYGWKDSLSVFVCMVLLSVFLGTLYTVFFAAADAGLGIVLGTCLKNKVELNRTQLLIMVLSAVFSLVGSVALATVFGIDLNAQIQEMQTMMNNMFRNAGMDTSAAGQLLSKASLMRMYVISLGVLGIVQGFIIFRLSLLILKRLRLPVPSPQPIGLYYPPRWTGYAALIIFFLYTWSMGKPFGNEPVQNIMQTVGMCGYMYLLIFGWIGISIVIRRYVSGFAGRFLAMIAALFLMMAVPFAVLVVGFLYISTDFHTRILRR